MTAVCLTGLTPQVSWDRLSGYSLCPWHGDSFQKSGGLDVFMINGRGA